MRKLLPVTKVVSDYSEYELMQFREQFAPIAQKIRHEGQRIERRLKNLLLGISITIGVDFIVLITLAAIELIKDIPQWLTCIIVAIIPLSLLLFFLVCIIFIFVIPHSRLECPACRNSLISLPQHLTYCPECGSNQLGKLNWLGRKCKACGKRLSHGKGGLSYKTRYCTHCGIFLDEKGF